MRTVWIVFHIDEGTLWEAADSVHADRETAEAYILAQRLTAPDGELKAERWSVRPSVWDER